MSKIARSIQEGAMALLRAKYRILIIFVIAFAALLYRCRSKNKQSDALVAVSFAVDAFFLPWLVTQGMKVATKVNVGMVNAAKDSLGKSLEVAFSGGQ